MGLTVSVSPVSVGLLPVDLCDRWRHESNVPTGGWDVHMHIMRLQVKVHCVELQLLLCGFLSFLNLCTCQTFFFFFLCKSVEISAVSLSYIIHQVAITAADRTVRPSRPYVLPAPAEVKVTLLLCEVS